MTSSDPLFAGMSPSRRRIVGLYEHFRFRPNGIPIVRRIAMEEGYTLDVKKNNSFVSRVVREYRKKRK